MKLLDSLFKIIEHKASESGSEYTIKLDPEHFIYKAHFPGEPITPGVCILQIACELLAKEVGRELAVSTVKNVKFLRIITPGETPVVVYSLNKMSVADGCVKAQISVSAGEDIYAKLSLICRIAK